MHMTQIKDLMSYKNKVIFLTSNFVIAFPFLSYSYLLITDLSDGAVKLIQLQTLVLFILLTIPSMIILSLRVIPKSVLKIVKLKEYIFSPNNLVLDNEYKYMFKDKEVDITDIDRLVLIEYATSIVKNKIIALYGTVVITLVLILFIFIL